MKKENVFRSVSLKLDAFDLLRIKTAIKRSIVQERHYCEVLNLSDYEVTCLERLLLRVELFEKEFSNFD